MITTKDLLEIWNYLSIQDTPRKADAIFLFGSQDIKSAEKAASLYQDGYAPKLLITGGHGEFTGKEAQEPEAVVLCRVVEKLGVLREDITLETAATNTGENIRFGIQKLIEAGIEAQTVILVNRPFMMRRIVATFKKEFPDIETIACPSDYSLEEYIQWMDEKVPGRAAQRLIAEVNRLIDYPKQGFMVEVDVPETIREVIL